MTFGGLYPGAYSGEETSGNPVIVVPFIAPATVVNAPLLQNADITVPFIAAITTVNAPTVETGKKARVSQAPVEAVVQPVPFARVSQHPAEVVVLPVPSARLSQAPIEVVVANDAAEARVSQAPIEVVLRNVQERYYVIIMD